MKRFAGQAGRFIGYLLHHLGGIVVGAVVLVLLAICLFGLRLSEGPIAMPILASQIATAVSGQGINVTMDEADLNWAGYKHGGGVPFFLSLKNVLVHNAVGTLLVRIPSARLVVFPSAIIGSHAPILVSGQGAEFSGSDVPVSLKAAFQFGRRLHFGRANVSVTLGAGHLGLGPTSLPISQGHFILALNKHKIVMSDGVIKLAQRGHSAPVMGLSGEANLTNSWNGLLKLTLDQVHADDLPQYWPASLAPGTRGWISRNISKGTASNAIINLSLAVPPDFASVSLTNVVGSFNADDLSLVWLNHAQPITHLTGQLNFTDINDLEIQATAGRLGDLALGPGTMAITGLDAATQTSILSVNLAGAIQAAFAIINAPPLNLLHASPPFLLNATGDVTAQVKASLPLLAKLPLSAVMLDVQAMLHHTALTLPFGGLGLQDGEIALDVTKTNLTAKGDMQFEGSPAHIDLAENFTDQSALRHLEASGTADAAVFDALGLKGQSMMLGPITGTAPFTLSLDANGTGGQNLSVSTDLTDTALAAPKFGWKKTNGQSMSASANFALQDLVVQTVDQLSLNGPALGVSVRRNGANFVIDMLHIGRTEASGIIRLPSTPKAAWQASLSGPALDFRPFASQSIAAPSKKPEAEPAVKPAPKVVPGPPWQLSLRFNTLYLSPAPAPSLGAFNLTANGTGNVLGNAQAAATGLAVTIAPAAPGESHVDASAQNAGDLLRALGAYGNMQDGTATLDADFGAAPLQGTLTLHDFRLLNVPLIAKMMQAVTIYGIGAATSGPGLGFDTAIIPFHLNNDGLVLDSARAFSASLGFTASGVIKFGNDEADINSTIVPAYAINSLLGKIPLVGGMFTAEKGGGLFAVRVHVTGPLSNPDISVNPVSAVTPGLLRGLFGVTEASPK